MAALSYEPKAWISPQQYLEIERAAETKHEYINGEVLAMAGASTTHVRLVGATMSLLYQQLRGKSCEPMMSDHRIFIASGLYAYPDVFVVCNPEYADEAFDTIINPSVIIEVLSPSTERYDRAEKFAHYQQLAALHDYLLISQHAMRVEHYARQSDSSWLLRVYENPSDIAQLSGAPATLLLSDIYERVQFAAAPSEFDSEADSAS